MLGKKNPPFRAVGEWWDKTEEPHISGFNNFLIGWQSYRCL